MFAYDFLGMIFSAHSSIVLVYETQASSDVTFIGKEFNQSSIDFSDSAFQRFQSVLLRSHFSILSMLLFSGMSMIIP